MGKFLDMTWFSTFDCWSLPSWAARVHCTHQQQNYNRNNYFVHNVLHTHMQFLREYFAFDFPSSFVCVCVFNCYASQRFVQRINLLFKQRWNYNRKRGNQLHGEMCLENKVREFKLPARAVCVFFPSFFTLARLYSISTPQIFSLTQFHLR